MSDEGEKPSANEVDELEEMEAEADRILDSARRPVDLPDVPDWEYTRPDYTKKHLDSHDMSGWRVGGIGLAAAYALLGAVGVGLLAGFLIDRGSGSYVWTAILSVVGAIGGLIAAIWFVVRDQGRGDS